MFILNGFQIKFYTYLVVILCNVKKQYTYILEVPLENINTHIILKNSFYTLFEHSVIVMKEIL